MSASARERGRVRGSSFQKVSVKINGLKSIGLKTSVDIIRFEKSRKQPGKGRERERERREGYTVRWTRLKSAKLAVKSIFLQLFASHDSFLFFSNSFPLNYLSVQFSIYIYFLNFQEKTKERNSDNEKKNVRIETIRVEDSIQIVLFLFFLFFCFESIQDISFACLDV